MTHLNPFQRYSAEEAHEVYSGIMTSLRANQDHKKGFIKVNKNKTRKSIKKMEKLLLSKSKEIALEPYLSSGLGNGGGLF